VALKKPSELFGNKSEDNNVPVIESDNSFRDELIKVESLSEQVIQLQQELSQKVIKNDLESLVLSQINTMQENFEYLQNDFKKSNKKDIVEFKGRVSELTEIVGNLVENELPKYKKQVTKNEVNIGNKFDELKEVVEENIVAIREDIDSKVNDIAEVIDNNLEYFNNQLQETSAEVKETSDTYNKLSKIVESKVSKENEKLEEYSQIIQSLHEAFVELEKSLQEKTLAYNQIIEEKFETISSDVNNKIDSIDEDVDTFKTQVSSDISSIKADVVINEQHIKNVDKYLQEHHQELVDLKEEVFDEIEKLPLGNLQENLERLEKKIDYIKETYSKIEPEVIVREVIKEGLLNEPPNTKNSDPLTPLDQKFVTLDQLQEHYRLFINRIQQQLSTIGGGGETRLKYLDDIVGIATNASAYDGKFLKYDHSISKFVFATAGGAGSQTLDVTLGLGNTSTLGMSVGVVTASYFVGNGSLLTNIPGSTNSGYANTAGIATYATSAGIATSVIGGIASVTSLSVSGISTLGTVQISSGIVTATVGVVTYYGDGSKLTGISASGGISSVSISTNTTNQSQYLTYVTGTGNTTGFGITTTGLVFNPSTGNLGIGTTNPIGQLQVSSGPVIIGSGTSTGTALQRLQVTGGAYISTSTGIGTTNPLQSLHVLGNLLVAAGSSTGQHITQKAYELNSGTLSWEGTAGQLFSITNNLTSGSIFSVNDVSGIPSIDVDAGGTVSMVSYGGSVGVGTTLATQKLHVQGNVRITGGLYDSNNNVGTAGSVLSSTGSGLSWIAAASGGGISSVSISTNTTNQSQYLTYVTGTGSTTGFGVSLTGLVFNPSTNNLGIGTATPAFKADIAGDARVTSTNKMRFGGTAGTTNFYIQYNSTTNSLDFVAG